jgi:hypothetical protein
VAYQAWEQDMHGSSLVFWLGSAAQTDPEV